MSNAEMDDVHAYIMDEIRRRDRVGNVPEEGKGGKDGKGERK